MAAWESAPVVGTTPAWQSAPLALTAGQIPTAPATESDETPTNTQTTPQAPPGTPGRDWEGILWDAARNSPPGLLIEGDRALATGVAGLDPAKIGGAAVEGWRNTPPLLSAESQAAQERIWGPLGKFVINPLFHIAGAVPAALNAAGGAISEAAIEGANAAGYPGFGRDINMLAQVAPMAHVGTGVPGAVEAGPRVNPLMETFNRMDAQRAVEQSPVSPARPTPAPAPEPVPAVPDAGPPREMPTVVGTPATASSSPAMAVAEPPGPQSVGAAASRDMTDPTYLAAKTPAQALNDFRTSVTQTARDRSSPGVTPGTLEDHNVYVPGVTRLESARVFDPEVAGNHNTMLDIDPAYKSAVEAHERNNHEALKEAYLQQAGDTNSIEALKQQRDAVSPDALGVFKEERAVNAQPVVDTIRQILDGPTGKIDAVRNTLQRIEKGLYDREGNLETLPSQLYGARRNLTTIRDSKALTQEASDAATSRREIGQVQAVLDQVIGSGADGFSEVYLPQWANFSRLIDQQSYLQSKTLGPGKVISANGNLTANGMQKLLEQIAVDKAKPGNSRAKTLTEDQLNNLIAIRNELAAVQYRDQLGASMGSPTVKKAAAAARLGKPIMGISPEAQEAAIHAVLAKTTLGAGNAVYQFGVKPIVERRRARKEAAIIEGTRSRLLRTDIPHE